MRNGLNNEAAAQAHAITTGPTSHRGDGPLHARSKAGLREAARQMNVDITVKTTYDLTCDYVE
jgi:hypothetical protein